MASNDCELRNMHREAPEAAVPSATPKTPTAAVYEETEGRPLSMRSSITAREPRRIEKHRNFYQLLIVLFYIILSVLSWVYLCNMAYKPYGRKSYLQVDNDWKRKTGRMGEMLRVNEKYIQAMFVVKTIATLLTIPVTGYVCAVAAMSYLQRSPTKSRLTLRQSMAVVDRRWGSPDAWVHAGSLPLYFGLCLMVLGALSQIIQSSFIQQETIRSGTTDTTYSTSFVDVLNSRLLDDSVGDSGRYLLQLQNVIASGIGVDAYERNLWNECEYGSSCMSLRRSSAYSGDYKVSDGRRNNFITPFKTNFSSGVHYLPQFAPRINSSLAYDSISEESFKRECRNETDSGAFYANYVHALEGERSYAGGFRIEVCITGDLRKSPWNRTRDRQDISESLYFSLESNILNQSTGNEPFANYWKASTNTTFGYFELPSLSNGYVPGRLQDKDPFTIPNDQLVIRTKRAVGNNTSPPAVPATERNLVNTRFLGPLSSVGLALFDHRSFLGARMRNATSFTEMGEEWGHNEDRNCAELYPFGKAMTGYCTYTSYSEYNVAYYAYNFMSILTRDEDVYDGLEKTTGETMLEMGLNMTNFLFITGKGVEDPRYIPVKVDEGVETIRPKISPLGKIFGSVLLGLHLGGLLLLAVYNLMYKLSTSHLGAEMMVKMGAAHAELLQESENRKDWARMTSILPAFAEGNDPSTRR